MKVHGLLRCKNESRWLAEVLDALRPVCDQILLFDDNSTDDTREIAADHGATVIRTPFSDRGFIDEAGDKDHLLAKLWESGAKLGDYCIMVDGDEVLIQEDIPALEEAMRNGVACGSMHILYAWDRKDQVRVDRWYQEFRRPSLFRLILPNLSFRRTPFGGNFHCSSAPAQLLNDVTPINVRLLHYGYMHKADRLRKYEFYNRVDANNVIEDCYRHMVIGDLFPAESAFRWAGPLELAPLDRCVRRHNARA
jgi:glycosyltransferase involved in cell wall biosynthesis